MHYAYELVWKNSYLETWKVPEGSRKGMKNSHTFFVDNEKEVAAFDPVKQFDTHPSLIGRTYNRPKLDTLKKDNKM